MSKWKIERRWSGFLWDGRSYGSFSDEEKVKIHQSGRLPDGGRSSRRYTTCKSTFSPSGSLATHGIYSFHRAMDEVQPVENTHT